MKYFINFILVNLTESSILNSDRKSLAVRIARFKKLSLEKVFGMLRSGGFLVLVFSLRQPVGIARIAESHSARSNFNNIIMKTMLRLDFADKM